MDYLELLFADHVRERARVIRKSEAPAEILHGESEHEWNAWLDQHPLHHYVPRALAEILDVKQQVAKLLATRSVG